MPRHSLDPEIVTDAAATIVDADGLARLTLARVAADLQVAPPSLYKHVAGLDDLVSRVTALSIRLLADDLTAAAVGRSGREALVAVAEAYRRFAIKHPGLYPLTQGSLQPSSDAQQVQSRRAFEIFAATVRSYNVPEDLSVHAIRIVRAALHGYADIEARGGFQMSDSIDESFMMLVDALAASLQDFGRTRHGLLSSHGD